MKKSKGAQKKSKPKFRLSKEETELKGIKGIRLYPEKDKALKDNPNFSLFIPLESVEPKEKLLELIGHLVSQTELYYFLVYTNFEKDLWRLAGT